MSTERPPLSPASLAVLGEMSRIYGKDEPLLRAVAAAIMRTLADHKLQIVSEGPQDNWAPSIYTRRELRNLAAELEGAPSAPLGPPKFDEDFNYFELEAPIKVQGSFEKDFSIEVYPDLMGHIDEIRVTKGVARYSVRKAILNRVRTWLYYKMPWLPSWVTWKFRKQP